MLQFIRVVTLVCLVAALGVAQEYRGKIRGTVSDSSNAVVPNAAVTLINNNTGVRITKQSNENGIFLFDYVDPGSYSLTIEVSGFKRFVQENIALEARADVTVDGMLSPGSTQESVTVSDTPVAVNFNNPVVQLTIDTKLTNDLPRFDRNPFKLSLLAPYAVNTRTEMNPYNSWAANSVDLGGGTSLKNDLVVDGSPIGIGHKATYTPPQDAVQEVNVQQNSVDAESGHSAGGAISMTMKSGTNDWHGNAWYLGRNPAFNAVTDRTVNSRSLARNNMFGASLGNPILKNKLFNFAIWEQWKQSNPINYFRTLPTELERQGDFSKSLNIQGGVRTIYDPFSTVVDTATNTVTRTPFAGNRIPGNRMDPVSVKLLGQLWQPNNPGDNITGLNNFKTVLSNKTDYWNISDRVDYVINDKWRVSGRYSRLHTTTTSNDPSPNQSLLYIVQNPSARHATSVVGDVVWTATPTMVVNMHGDYHSLVDDFDSPRDYYPVDKLSQYWANDWYSGFARNDKLPAYFPGIQIGGSNFGQGGTTWYQHPNGWSYNAKVSQIHGNHYWKAGFDFRRSGGVSLVTGNTNFNFTQALTANTYNSPNTQLVGHEYATFLLGAIDGNSRAIVKPVKNPRNTFFGFFAQDDWKIGRNVTVTLGLRYEFDTPWHDPNYEFSRYLDLNAPNQAMQAAPPQVPGAVQPYLQQPWKLNGQWLFTDSNNPYSWQMPLNNFMPRVGVAWRINDKTSLRAGYSRFMPSADQIFIDPPFSGFEALNFLEPAYMGFDATQPAQGLLAGIPQATLADPFPANKNPLIPPRGKDFGPYLGVGGPDVLFFYQDAKRPVNDRLSLSIQRQLPGQILLDATGFLNFGSNQLYTRNLNMTDPNLSYTYKTALQQNVDNPFYNYLTPSVFPGPLRNQAKVSIGSLLKPYPQYGGIYQVGMPGFNERYQSVTLQARRPFANGFNLLFGYSYIRERSQTYFNDPENYLDQRRYLESANPRHRISAAGTYELPFGKGRRYLANANRLVDGVLGGWQLLGALYWNSGTFLRFGGLNWNGSNPVIDNQTPQKWFDTSAFTVQTPFTPRVNPYSFTGLTGPSVWQLDSTLSKNFVITERVKTELKMAAYNATNHLNREDPVVDRNNANFGTAIRQRGNYFGRQLEVGLKIFF